MTGSLREPLVGPSPGLSDYRTSAFRPVYLSGKRASQREPLALLGGVWLESLALGVKNPISAFLMGGQKEEEMIKGRMVLALLLVGGIVPLGSTPAQQKDAPHAGWISDESCGAQHTKPGGADCVQKCWRGGASVGHPEWKPQRAVLVADDDQTVWIVDNPGAVTNFPAAHVMLVGKFDSDKKTIHVEKITPAAQ
jgi:hypothetical protein